MPASSNFQEAIREAQSSVLVGPNVVNKALPYVGGGMVLTSIGVIGGLSMMATPLFMPLFWVAVIGNLVLFFVAQNVALKGNNATALPLLSVYSLITGFTRVVSWLWREPSRVWVQSAPPHWPPESPS